MAHEILEHDQVLLHAAPAWHGFGQVVPDAPTAVAAQKRVLDWEVLQAPLLAMCDDGEDLAVHDYQLNYRSDTHDQLGIVGTGYCPIQNSELAAFCDALAEQGDTIKVESCGSIRNGKKVWFLLKGESFSVRDKDEVKPYILVSNGHDGWTALRCTPTTIRVVCSNTLHMVIPQREAEGRIQKAMPASFVAHHTSTILGRVHEAQAALKLYGKSLDATRQVIDQLAAKDVSREDVQKFFLECYTRDFAVIPTEPKKKTEQNARDKAMDACAKMFNRFDQERDLCGATAWNMLNAYTWMTQHDLGRLKDQEKAAERKVESKLFGKDSVRAYNALTAAMAL